MTGSPTQTRIMGSNTSHWSSTSFHFGLLSYSSVHQVSHCPAQGGCLTDQALAGIKDALILLCFVLVPSSGWHQWHPKGPVTDWIPGLPQDCDQTDQR